MRALPAAVLACVAGSLPAQGAVSPLQALAGASIRPDGGNLFEVLAKRFDAVRLRGLRTFTLFDGSNYYRYREIVRIDPSRKPARFSQELAAEVYKEGAFGGKQPPDLLRKKAYGLRVGFLHNFRDFRVYDPKLARANYTVQPMGNVIRLNRLLRIFDLYPRKAGRPWYRIFVDAKAEIVLDQIRFAPAGRVESLLTYEAVEIGSKVRFDPKVTWWSPWMKVTDHPNLQVAESKLGFKALTPAADALSGLGLKHVRTVHQPLTRKTWLVLVYTDGIEPRFLLETRSSEPGLVAAAGTESLKTVLRYRLGPAVQLMTSHKGLEVLYVGPQRSPGLPALFTSCFR